MSRWNDSELDEEMRKLMENVPDAESMEKMIRKGVDRRIRNTVLRVLAVAMAAALLLFFIISPLMNAVYPDPCSRKDEMLSVLRDYYELTGPYREVIGLDAEPLGFARYRIGMQIHDGTRRLIAGAENVVWEMDRGEYRNQEDPEGVTVTVVNRFDAGEADEKFEEWLCGLPASAEIYLSVYSAEELDLKELQQAEVTADWIQPEQPSCDFQGGISLHLSALYEEDDDRRDMSEDELLEVYRNNMRNLLDHRQFWREFTLCDGRGSTYYDVITVLQQTYENAAEMTKIRVRNYSFHGTPDQVMHHLQTYPAECVNVENVRLW